MFLHFFCFKYVYIVSICYFCVYIYFFSSVELNYYYFFVLLTIIILFFSWAEEAQHLQCLISSLWVTWSSFWINNSVWRMINPLTCPPFSFSDTSYWKHEQFALLTWQQNSPYFCWHYLIVGNSYYRCAEMHLLTLFTLKDH